MTGGNLKKKMFISLCLMVENLRICNLRTGSPTKFEDLQFAIWSAIKRNLRICDCGLSLRICELKKKLHGTPWQICHWCQRCTLSCEYFRELSNKFEPALIGYSGAWGKMFHEKKTWSRKSRDTVPLNFLLHVQNYTKWQPQIHAVIPGQLETMSQNWIYLKAPPSHTHTGDVSIF
jgi:hypothetical protein